jgi:hypothetical protein
METVPCPQEDHGICTIPDKTAVVKGGVVSVHVREEIEASFPELNLRDISLRRVAVPVEEEMLIRTIDQVGSVVERNQGLATAVLEDRAVPTAIYVSCSCGHWFVADLG